MMKRWIGLTLIGIVLTTGVAAAQQTTQPAQTTPSTSTTTTTGTFDQLPPGEQKIARALFEAQKTSTDPKAPKSLTLDQIAAMKDGKGWGEVFKEMKAQGLVTEKNLGQVVSNFERRHKGTEAKGEKAEKAEKAERPERPERGGHGGGGGRGR